MTNNAIGTLMGQLENSTNADGRHNFVLQSPIGRAEMVDWFYTWTDYHHN